MIYSFAQVFLQSGDCPQASFLCSLCLSRTAKREQDDCALRCQSRIKSLYACADCVTLNRCTCYNYNSRHSDLAMRMDLNGLLLNVFAACPRDRNPCQNASLNCAVAMFRKCASFLNADDEETDGIFDMMDEKCNNDYV